jgi:hypothetical protein
MLQDGAWLGGAVDFAFDPEFSGFKSAIDLRGADGEQLFLF